MITGTLVAESMKVGASIDVASLRATSITRTDVASSTSDAQPSTWTLIAFEVDDEFADDLAAQLADALLSTGGWYADFVHGDDHVVVFAERVFRYRRGDADARGEAADYGRSVGVPEHQLDWED